MRASHSAPAALSGQIDTEQERRHSKPSRRRSSRRAPWTPEHRGAQLLALVAGAFLEPARPPCTGRRCASPAAQIDGRTKFEQSFEVKPADVLQVEEDHLGIAYTPSSQLLWAEQIVETVPWLRERVESLSPDEIATIAEHDMVLSPLTTYLRPSAQAQVRLALEVAFLTHRGQTRRAASRTSPTPSR